jgi:hypothetical protein
MSIVVWLIVVVLAVVAVGLLALRHQSRMYPPGRPRIGEPEQPDQRNREPRSIGFIHGGGHG